MGTALLWNIATDKPNHYPFTYYSSVAETFGIRETINEQTTLKDAQGNTYTQAQFDSILPMVYFRQLTREGNLPDSLQGVEMNQKIIAMNNFYFRYRPADKNKPVIPLYTLFESMPKRVDLEMPGDRFRLTRKLEFVQPETNTIDIEKSNQFDAALREKGFLGPPKIVAGNPTTRKAYDEGYFIVDSQNKLFHLKMVNGRPYVSSVDLPENINPVWITVTEYPARQFYAFLITDDGRLFTIFTGGYEVKEIPVPAFNPERDNLLIMGNLFHWNVEVTSETAQTLFAVGASDYQLKDSITFSAPEENEKLYNILFPFSLRFTSVNNEFVKPRIEFTGFGYLISAVLLLLGYILIRRYQKKSIRFWTAALIFLTGTFGLLASIIIGNTEEN
ncbi:DUF4857 domain-containing protein [Marinilabilia salmonicolor]|uniref:DUF4857 domain-containing protein n=1 Tax=Marinilabilia salmonicolor TaxID=989 RepID=UPI0006885D6A|nr:DUF4857 domain-containing protein [Marinilabilia salmonicolor]